MMGAASLELACALQGAPPGLPDARAVMERAGSENFPVAARLLPRGERRALLAVYGFARLADELGDELRGDRLAALDWLEGELDRAYAGRSSIDTPFGEQGGIDDRPARAPLFVSLQQTLRERDLPREGFVRLIEANRVDQRVSQYETWEQLRSYCHLSADPVGELVLAIFGLRTPARVALSDRVCTGLQLAEHLQDVGEDLRRGRIYLPEEDLARFGCSHERLSGPGLREAIAFEVKRARELLWAGAPLAAGVRGRAKLAIAAFAGGGLAALEAIERAGFEVLGEAPRASRAMRARSLASVLARARGERRG